MKKTLLFLLFIFTSCAFQAQEGQKFVRENYVKQEARIEMRDGIKLYTAIYSPKDTTQDYPLLIWRTPYSSGPYGEDKYGYIPGYLAKEKYIFVFQDVRGKFMSEGDFVNMRPYIPNKTGDQIDEASDTYDTIDWLVKNVKHNNGKAGMFGISYPGFYAAMGLMDSHPALKAVSPQAPISDWFIGDDMHHNGALSLLLTYNFFSVFGQPREGLNQHWPDRPEYPSPDAYSFFLEMGPLKNANNKYLNGGVPFWNEIMEHGTYDEFWQSRNTRQHFEDVKPAVMTVGGWYDSENLFGALETYKAIEAKNPDIYNIIVMGPWVHGGWSRTGGESLGAINFGGKTSEYYMQEIEIPFFNHFLKDGPEPALPEVLFFETGSNEWNRFEQFPPENTGMVYLYPSEGGGLSFSAPSGRKAGFDEFMSDPSRPVPYTNIIQDSRKFYPKEYMIEDQRFASRRPDVLVYETEPLDEDITLAGPVEAELYVSTTGTDADWVVKLIDVYPDGAENPEPNPDNVEMGNFQRLVRFEIMRGKFRNSYSEPEPFSPGKVTPVKFSLNAANHTFKKGHKIMVQIQSSFFPFFDRNPQTFTNIYKASKEDFRKAEHKIFRTQEYPSRIGLPVIK